MPTKPPFFLCPECGKQVDPAVSVFCLSCGLNLTLVKRLPASKICPNCKEPGLIVHDETEMEGYRRISYEHITCLYCGHNSRHAHAG